jgi:hypothetical protein
MRLQSHSIIDLSQHSIMDGKARVRCAISDEALGEDSKGDGRDKLEVFTEDTAKQSSKSHGENILPAIRKRAGLSSSERVTLGSKNASGGCRADDETTQGKSRHDVAQPDHSDAT